MKPGRNPGPSRRHLSGLSLAKGRLSLLIITGLLLITELADCQDQPAVLGHATDFTSDEYFEPPNQQRVKMRLSGASASPLPGGLLDITDLRIETFNLSGRSEEVVRAPECIYAPYDGLANSAGHVDMATSDGKIAISGDGFLWRQSDNSLTISNNVHTVIKMKGLLPSLP
jgi:hypothetical protein